MRLPRQRTADLDTLYYEAQAAQSLLAQATKDVANRVGGVPVIPSTLKSRERAVEKANILYGGDTARITDIARSSIVCDSTQKVYEALEEAKSRYRVVLIKNRFDKPLNGYRDVLLNLELPNNHIVELQLHLRGIYEVKEGIGHRLYEQARRIEAKAKEAGRPLTSQERGQIGEIQTEMKTAYEEAFHRYNAGENR